MNHKIICARYNENLDWLNPYSEKTIVYNKGNRDFNQNKFKNVIHCANLGREGGTFLDYIIENYNRLPDYILFVQGKPFDHVYAGKLHKAQKFIREIQSRRVPFQYLSTHQIKLKPNEYKEYTSGIPALVNGITNIICQKSTLIDHISNIKNKFCKVEELQNEISQIEEQEIHLHNFNKIVKKHSYFITNETGQQIRDELYLLFKDPVLDKLIEYNYSFGYGAMFQVSKERIRMHDIHYWSNLKIGFNKLKPDAGWGLEKMWNLILNLYYQRVEFILNSKKIKNTPFDYLTTKKEINKSSIVLFITNEINYKWPYYKSFFNKCYLICKKKVNVKENRYNINYKTSLQLFFKGYKEVIKSNFFVYFNGLNNHELRNSLSELSTSIKDFYFIIDNCLFYNNFYLDGKNLAVIYDYYLINNIKILGYSNQILIGKFIK